MLIAFSLLVLAVDPPQAKLPAGRSMRPQWTTSKVIGRPESPPPFQTTDLFPKVRFDHPVDVKALPGSDRLAVVEQSGKLFTIDPRGAGGKKDLLCDLTKEVVTLAQTPRAVGVDASYGIAFHPKFAENRYAYVCYVIRSSKPEQHPDGTRISRFKVSAADPPRFEPASETILLTFMAGGHNAGCLQFGHDGCLYISSGDAADPSPPDKYRTGQDCSDLLASILRIDVDRTDGELPYAIPKDNPLVGKPGLRGEVFAFGLRNPWKYSFDRQTGDLWAGDVGWELWEMVFHVRKGSNCGWSIVEGPQSINADVKQGPGPIQKPVIALPHTDAASMTGGYVYRGKKLPELNGAYIFGDWETKRIWAARIADDKLVSLADIVEPTVRAITFAETNDGEVIVADYDAGSLHGFVRSPPPTATAPFPTKLSASGLFADTAAAKPAAGVLPFAINAPRWADGASAERWLALPGAAKVGWNASDVQIVGSMFSRQLDFPTGAVLVNTLSLELEPGVADSRRRIETQLLHFDGKSWRAYSYRWNDEQTDGDLVPAEGAERTLAIKDAHQPSGSRRYDWSFASRTQCMTCHNPWAQQTLAFNIPQLNGAKSGAGRDQLAELMDLGVFERRGADGKPSPTQSAGDLAATPKLVDPGITAISLDDRARSYLHANCGHCHRFGGGGAVDLQLHSAAKRDELKAIGVRNQRGNFGIPGGLLIAPGKPHDSVMYYRMAKFGRDHMPHLASERPDPAGLKLIADWIESLPGATKPPATPSGLRTIAEALPIARGFAADTLPDAERRRILADAEKAPPEVRDLFAGYRPSLGDRLGNNPKPGPILKLVGNADAGGKLYWGVGGLNCKTCHVIGKEGIAVGPELTHIAAKRKPAELLESVLEPSKNIEPAFVAYLVQTNDGQSYTGLVVERSATHLTLKTATNQTVRLASESIARSKPSKQSLMPEGLVKDLSPQQAADLLAYLANLK